MEESEGDQGDCKKQEFVRADLLNLADLDAVLEKRRKASQVAKEPPEAPKSSQIKEEWEIDTSNLVLKGQIATGGYGTVHRGDYQGQDVAVKLLEWGDDRSKRTAFLQEVAVWQKLDHPNVTKFVGACVGRQGLQVASSINGQPGAVDISADICCVVVEYIAGGTLKSYLIDHFKKKLSLKAAVQLALGVSRGLAYLHSQKIVHRDVKSENMLLDTKRRVKIADFGVARVEAQNPKDMTGATGTPSYMAPEVIEGKPYNRKCDVYSFGILLWEIYCCDMPFPDISFADLTYAVVKQDLRPNIPSCCPDKLSSIMRRCWAPNPDERPEMNEVVTLLEGVDTRKGRGMTPTVSKSSWFCFRL